MGTFRVFSVCCSTRLCHNITSISCFQSLCSSRYTCTSVADTDVIFSCDSVTRQRTRLITSVNCNLVRPFTKREGLTYWSEVSGLPLAALFPSPFIFSPSLSVLSCPCSAKTHFISDSVWIAWRVLMHKWYSVWLMWMPTSEYEPCVI